MDITPVLAFFAGFHGVGYTEITTRPDVGYGLAIHHERARDVTLGVELRSPDATGRPYVVGTLRAVVLRW